MAEIGFNLIPQYTDFNVRFDNITKDNVPLNFGTISYWIFTLGTATSATGLVTKVSNGYASGDFSIPAGSGYVSVAMRASELSYGKGQYYVALFADTSGSKISHSEKYLTIHAQVRPSGV
jgi:hypothetical protein